METQLKARIKKENNERKRLLMDSFCYILPPPIFYYGWYLSLCWYALINKMFASFFHLQFIKGKILLEIIQCTCSVLYGCFLVRSFVRYKASEICPLYAAFHSIILWTFSKWNYFSLVLRVSIA